MFNKLFCYIQYIVNLYIHNSNYTYGQIYFDEKIFDNKTRSSLTIFVPNPQNSIFHKT